MLLKSKVLFSVIVGSFLVGCPGEDCAPEDNDYSHTEYDCYIKDYSVDVCNGDSCRAETRSKRVCEDVHVCYSEDY